MPERSAQRLIPALTLLALLGGCAGAPARQATLPPGSEPVVPIVVAPAASPVASIALEQARQQIGRPYRFGGADPAGFDCSGLVHFVFREAGVDLPRSAEAQQGALDPVDRHALLPGDLVFFRLPQPHVGIYVGAGEFIHAPGSGRTVESARLDQPWFILGFAGAGRVASAGEATASAH